jgi:hypothetical protein
MPGSYPPAGGWRGGGGVCESESVLVSVTNIARCRGWRGITVTGSGLVGRGFKGKEYELHDVIFKVFTSPFPTYTCKLLYR